MTITVTNIIPPKQAEIAQTTQYTSLNCKTVIDKFTVTNTGSANAVITVNLVPKDAAPTDANTMLKSRAIAPGETYTCPELVGQVLEPGGYISTLAGAASVLTINSAGRQIT